MEYGLSYLKWSERMFGNTEYLRETNIVDGVALKDTVSNVEIFLIEEQRIIYQTVLDNVESNSGTMFFLNAPVRIRKIFLTNLLLYKVRSSYSIVLATASLGIDVMLLEGGKTVHAAYK